MFKEATMKSNKLIFEKIITIILIVLFFSSSLSLSYFYENSYAASPGKAYSLLISGMAVTGKSTKLMEDILNRNTIKSPQKPIKKSYEGSKPVGKGGITLKTWDSWIKNAFSGSTQTDICYFYYDGHSSEAQNGYRLWKKNEKVGEVCSYSHLLTTLAKNTKGDVVIIVDTCFAARIINNIDALGEDKNRFYIIAGVEENQEDYANPIGENAHFFTEKLFKGTKNTNGKWAMDTVKYDRKITLSEIENYTKKLSLGRKPKFYGKRTKVIFKYNASTIKLNKTAVSIRANGTTSLKATVTGKKGTVKWTSSNKSIATVSSKGKVTGKKKGKATITATINGAKATCKVTVTVPVNKVALNKASASIAKGKTLTLKASVSPSNATKKTITWTSSNKKVATVTSKGVVKGVANGTATITAKAADGSGKKATCKITVKSATKAVPNVTDKVLKMKYSSAAKTLGLTQKTTYYFSKYRFSSDYYIRKGKRPFDGSPMLEFNTYATRGGEWNLLIEDKSIAFQGVKVGMSESKARSVLGKKWTFNREWDLDEYMPGATMISFSKNMNWGYEEGDNSYLSITIKNKKVISIYYFTFGEGITEP